MTQPTQILFILLMFFSSISYGQCPAGTTISATAKTSPADCANESGRILIQNINGGTSPYLFSLDGVNFSSQVSYSDLGAGNYSIYILDNDSCRDTSYAAVSTFCPPLESLLKIYNTFTPNDDGFNDTWTILGIDAMDFSQVKVFNRNGHLVFNERNYKNANGWDGKQFGVNLPVGTYFYFIEVKDQFGREETFTGNITIMR